MLEKLADKGEIVAMAIPIIIISDLSRFKIAITVAAADTMTYTGKINLISSVADPLARDFTAQVELDNPGMRISPGIVAEVQVNTGGETNVIILPSAHC